MPTPPAAAASWTRDFLEHCLRGTNYATGKLGTPIDFISFHAKGSPAFVDGHVRMGIANQLRTINDGFRIVASFPELKGKPIVIGESDPDGCAACQGPQLGYRNGTMYSSYTAASFARKYDLADRHGVNLEGALTWAFEFEDQPYFAGFRVLATNGIDLPVMNVFRMFSLMGGRRLDAQSSGAVALDAILDGGVRGAPDVSALAALDGEGKTSPSWPGTITTTTSPARTPRSRSRSAAFPMQTARSFCTTTAWIATTATRSRSGNEWARLSSPRPSSTPSLPARRSLRFSTRRNGCDLEAACSSSRRTCHVRGSHCSGSSVALLTEEHVTSTDPRGWH